MSRSSVLTQRLFIDMCTITKMPFSLYMCTLKLIVFPVLWIWSGSALLLVGWIRIRILNADLDLEGRKNSDKYKKSEDML
jgi:hypothetical protein